MDIENIDVPTDWFELDEEMFHEAINQVGYTRTAFQNGEIYIMKGFNHEVGMRKDNSFFINPRFFRIRSK